MTDHEPGPEPGPDPGPEPTNESVEPRLVPPESIPPVSAEDLVDGEAPADEDVEDDERRYPSTIGGAIYLLVLVVVGIALVLVAVQDWRTGIRLMGGTLIVAAAARVVLRPRDAGMLAVRHKALDVGALIVLGGLLIFLAGSIPDQPGF